jgi:hypothetical protein
MTCLFSETQMGKTWDGIMVQIRLAWLMVRHVSMSSYYGA